MVRRFNVRSICSTHVHDDRPIDYPLNGMYLGSRDLFKFWQTIDNMSEMVQDRDTVITEDNVENHRWPVEQHRD